MFTTHIFPHVRDFSSRFSFAFFLFCCLFGSFAVVKCLISDKLLLLMSGGGAFLSAVQNMGIVSSANSDTFIA